MAAERQPTEGSEASEEARTQRLSGVTWRSLVIAILATVLISYWIDMAEVITLFCQITESVPPVPAVGFLVLLVLLVPALRRLWRWLALDRREIVIIYVFLTVSTAMAGPGIIRFLINTIPVLFYFATPSNGFAEYQQYMPEWMVPHSPEVLRTLYEGSEEGAIPWRAWATPLVAWGIFFLAFWLILMGTMAILRRQWSEKEKLTYPLEYLPLEMTRGLETRRLVVQFFRNPVMWTGFAVAFIYNATNIINAYIPSVTALGKYYDIGALFTERPWSAISPLQFHYRPAVIGFGYLMSTEIALSTWVFFLAIRLLAVGAAAAGYEQAGFPFRKEQSMGAYVILGLGLLWVGRHQIAEAFRAAVRKEATESEANEPMSYRTGFLILAGGLGTWLAWVMYAGMNLRTAAVYLALLLLSAIVYARVRAETGVPMIWAFPYGVHHKAVTYMFGSKWLHPGGSWANATIFSTMLFMSRGYFPSLVGYQVEGWRLAGSTQVRRRAMSWVLIAAVAVGFFVGMWLHLRSYYEWGAGGLTALSGWGSGTAQQEYEALVSYARGDAPPNLPRSMGMAAGGVVALALTVLRTIFLRFPLHPLAYGIATSFGHKLWAPLFVVWLVKTLIFRVSGMASYRALIPAFIGLALGHFFTAGLLYGLVGTFGGEQFRRYGVWFG
ncbi:MAG: DUF6785 family protein [Armatimonadota bacterium]|nr:DUF6785 family protein [Armatimonadota bacterium]